MKILGIAFVWVGALCVLFAIHVLVGIGAVLLSAYFLWKSKKERDFVRNATKVGAGIGYRK